jgi:hypothetical protein
MSSTIQDRPVPSLVSSSTKTVNTSNTSNASNGPGAPNTSNASNGPGAPGAPNTSNRPAQEETGPELWSLGNALGAIILILVVFAMTLFGSSQLANIASIKANWANERCSPMIMPFASFFGYNTKENFDFCLGRIFRTHSEPYMGSMGSIFGQFGGMLTTLFQSMSSMRNTIASMGGGINLMFQEFTDRISAFFFRLRISAIRLKTLFGRMYAILFSIMYMGTSGITGMTSFTNTALFSFLNTFCFPGETLLRVQDSTGRICRVPIKDVRIGDILMPGHCPVTATFQFYAKGQPMVQLGSTVVSTNHYVYHEGKRIQAGDHPFAIDKGPWTSDEPLYCLNTANHHLPVGPLVFMDYDETAAADTATMNMIDRRINGTPQAPLKDYPFTESGCAMGEHVRIKTLTGIKRAVDLQIGDRLSTGCTVVGWIRRCVTEVCDHAGTLVTPATLYWDTTQWRRYGETHPIRKEPCELLSFVVTPHSQIEWEDGTIIRDYMEWCSPDAEQYYTEQLTA